MTKRWVVAFAIVGYLIPVWYYASGFGPITSKLSRTLLWDGCIACVNVTGFHGSRLWAALVFIGPVNSVLYAAAGYILGLVTGRMLGEK